MIQYGTSNTEQAIDSRMINENREVQKDLTFKKNLLVSCCLLFVYIFLRCIIASHDE
jgi:hypothetical protein